MENLKTDEVIKLLEHFGIYPRFECIKCKQVLGNINLAMAHVTGKYLDCIKAGKEIEVGVPANKPRKYSKKMIRSINMKTDKRVKYSDEDKDYIINSTAGNVQLAKKFNTTPGKIIKLKYAIRKKRGMKGIRSRVPNKVFKKNNLKPSTDYKIQDAGEE